MQRLIKVLVILISFVAWINSYAQIDKAEWYYQSFQYAKSIKYFKKALNKPGNEEYLYDIADAYFHLKDFKNAQIYFMRYVNEAPKLNTNIKSADTLWVKDSVDTNKQYKKIIPTQLIELHPKKTIAYLYLGECLMSNNLYDEAKRNFNLYFRVNPNDKRGKLFSKACDDVKQWATMPAKYEVYSIPKINSKYSDFSAVDYNGGVVFVSDRLEDVINENNDGWTQTPYLSMMFSKSQNPSDSSAFGKVKDFLLKYKGDYHTGPVCFNKSQTELYISRVDEFKGKKQEKNPIHKPKLFFANFKNGKWSNLSPFQFNSDDYAIAHPSISEDENYLFFTSDMPGGIGGTDIWYCKKINGAWSNPINPGSEINTSGNESFPFLSATNTFYFSSDGWGGLGGLDIFSSSFLDEFFSQPINLKAFINSPSDDFGIYFKPDNKGGYFSSNRAGGLGKDDIYGFKVNENIVNITGKILLTDNIKDGAESVKILLMTQEGKIIQTTTTDNTGFFKFENIINDQFYLVKVDDSDPLLKRQKKLFMADENNRIVKVTVISDKGYFTFENLPSDLTTLKEIDTDEVQLKSKLLNGFLVSGIDSSVIAGVVIYLNSEKGEQLQSRITDSRGYFAFNNIFSEQTYSIHVDEESPLIKKLNKVLVKDKLGKVILSIVRNEGGKFNFELLQTDQSTIALMDEEDTKLNRSFKGKLLNAEDNSPVWGAKIALQNKNKEILQYTLTDDFGNFRFFNILTNQDIQITADVNDPALLLVNKIKITDSDGKLLFYAERKKEGFKFEILQSDPSFIAMLEAPESNLTKKQFGGKLIGDGNEAVVNADVLMTDEQGNVIGKTKSDERGNFRFLNIVPDQNFLIKLNEADPVIQKYNTITIYDRKGKEVFKGGKFIGKFNFLVINNDPAYLSFLEEVPDVKVKKRLSGVMLNGDGSNNPIANTEVWLLNQSGDLIEKSTTNNKGVFLFKNLKSDETYLVSLNPDDPAIQNISRIVLKDNNGKELYAGKKDDKGTFSFNILPTDNNLLLPMNAMDETLPRDLTGFMLAGDANNAPIAGAIIKLVNESGIVVGKTVTSANGKFKFTKLRYDENYNVLMDESDPALANYKNVILTDKNGKILFTSRLGKGGFNFTLLKDDINTLGLLDLEDVNIERELKGYLYDDEVSGKPVSSLEIKLIDDSNNQLASAKTNDKGFFRFSHLAAGKNYILALDESNDELQKYTKLIIKDASGNIVLKSIRDQKQGFKFSLLGSDPSVLSLMIEEEDTRIKIDLDGLLLSDDGMKAPIPNVEVLLYDAYKNLLSKTSSNDKGYFKFSKQIADQNFIMEVNSESPVFKKYNSFLLTDRNGKTVKRVLINKNGKFYFEILQSDHFALASINTHDELIAFTKYNKKPVNEFKSNLKMESKEIVPKPQNVKKEQEVTIEDEYLESGQILAQVYYPFANSALTNEAKVDLNKIASAMKSNPKMIVEINAYADSRGRADYNYKLSNKRREAVISYISARGISKKRIKGKTYGETQLQNGCYDNVICTNEQHAQNRRTDIINRIKK
jgi:outer membrane protein OmpA-like peptidoglycan-associated protein/tetratricopeptide (TPR) repeat protein